MGGRRATLTLQQSRLQVGLGDVLSVVSVNLKKDGTRTSTKNNVSANKSAATPPSTTPLTNRSASSQHAPVIRAKMASSQSCWWETSGKRNK